MTLYRILHAYGAETIDSILTYGDAEAYFTDAGDAWDNFDDYAAESAETGAGVALQAVEISRSDAAEVKRYGAEIVFSYFRDDAELLAVAINGEITKF